MKIVQTTCLIIALLLAQVGLAQHAPVHVFEHVFDHNQSTVQHYHDTDHDTDHHPENSAKEQCQLCLSSKIFSHAVIISAEPVVFTGYFAVQMLGQTEILTGQNTHIPYAPRGPPYFLI